MADAKLVRHLKVLTDKAATGVVPTQKLFSIGDPGDVPGHGEVVAVLSWVDDNLSRFVVSSAASSAWGRQPAWIVSLPNRAVKKRDAVFLITGVGDDRDEPNPSGEGTLHFVHLGSPRPLWTGPSSRIYIYKLDAVQTRAMLSRPGAP